MIWFQTCKSSKYLSDNKTTNKRRRKSCAQFVPQPTSKFVKYIKSFPLCSVPGLRITTLLLQHFVCHRQGRHWRPEHLPYVTPKLYFQGVRETFLTIFSTQRIFLLNEMFHNGCYYISQLSRKNLHLQIIPRSRFCFRIARKINA